jgi:hypothetical protein
MQVRLPSFILVALVLAAAVATACGSDENGNAFGDGTGYTPQTPPTMLPLPPGAGPYDGGAVPPKDTGTPTPKDSGTPPADAGTVTDSGTAAADSAG